MKMETIKLMLTATLMLVSCRILEVADAFPLKPKILSTFRKQKLRQVFILYLRENDKKQIGNESNMWQDATQSFLKFVFPTQYLASKIDDLSSKIEGLNTRFDNLSVDIKVTRKDAEALKENSSTKMKQSGITRELAVRSQLSNTYSPQYARSSKVRSLRSYVSLFGIDLYQHFEGESDDGPVDILQERRQRFATSFLVSISSIRSANLIYLFWLLTLIHI